MCKSKQHVNHLEWHGNDGLLCVLEKFPFTPQRMFYVTNVLQGEVRGHHAHHETQQVLICIQGLIQVGLYDGYEKYTHLLPPHHWIYVPNLVWDSQIYMTGNDVVLVLCSTKYDKHDYIHSLPTFEEIIWNRDGKLN